MAQDNIRNPMNESGEDRPPGHQNEEKREHGENPKKRRGTRRTELDHPIQYQPSRVRRCLVAKHSGTNTEKQGGKPHGLRRRSAAECYDLLFGRHHWWFVVCVVRPSAAGSKARIKGVSELATNPSLQLDRLAMTHNMGTDKLSLFSPAKACLGRGTRIEFEQHLKFEPFQARSVQKYTKRENDIVASAKWGGGTSTAAFVYQLANFPASIPSKAP